MKSRNNTYTTAIVHRTIKSMRTIILIITFIPLTGIQAFSKSMLNTVLTDSLYILYTDWETLYNPPVSCMNYEDMNNDKYVIKSKREIKRLCKEIEHLSPLFLDDSDMDVRCKIYFFSSGKTTMSACIDRRKTLLDGSFYYTSEKLINAINRIISKNILRKDNEHKRQTVRNKMTGGMDSLQNYLRSQTANIYKFNKKDTTRITGFCRIRKSGRTFSVEISEETKKTIPENIIQKIISIYKNEIMWNPNKERLLGDTQPIRIVLITKP